MSPAPEYAISDPDLTQPWVPFWSIHRCWRCPAPPPPLLTVTVAAFEVVELPAPSCARAVNACAPFATDVVSKLTEYGAVLSVANATALRRNSTNANDVSSDAVADTAIVPDTVAPFAGAVSDTVGGVTSPLPVGHLLVDQTATGKRDCHAEAHPDFAGVAPLLEEQPSKRICDTRHSIGLCRFHR